METKQIVCVNSSVVVTMITFGPEYYEDGARRLWQKESTRYLRYLLDKKKEKMTS
jgi:hypothetical protein